MKVAFKTVRVRAIFKDTVQNESPENVISFQVHETMNEDFPIGITYMYRTDA